MKRSLLRVACVAAIFGLYAACSDNSSTSPKPFAAPAGQPAFDFATAGNGSGGCIGDDAVIADGLVSNWVSGNPAATEFNCTSNDISVATTVVTEFSFIGAGGPFTNLPLGDRITCTPGQTVFLHTFARLQNSAQSRYNIGVWIANDPTLGIAGSAVSGTCFHYNLATNSVGSSDLDGDSCRDMTQGAQLATMDLDVLQVVCPAGQANVTVNNCIGWENSNLNDPGKRGSCPNTDPANSGSAQISTAQGFRDGTLPETKSKCNCTPFVLPVDVRGKITIIKNTVGGDGTFQFTSDVGANSDPVVPSPFSITTVGLTGQQIIDKVVANAAGTSYHIAESTVDPNFDFTLLACTPNNAFASATVDQATKTATITIGSGGEITCTFTNTRKTFLTLVKTVTNNAGGTKTLSDFPLTASGPVTISGVSGGTAVTSRVVSAGTYTLSEQTQAGYTASSWTCSGGTQSGTNSIALATGNSATCTINNDDNAPLLTLVKVVTNNAGGTKTLSDFPLTASGPVTISGVSGGTAVTGRGVNAGTYTLSEQTQAGYTPSSWTCSGGTQSGTNSIALALGGAATCTISNDDIAPTLTLVKVVTNNDGGTKTLSDFPLTASGPVTISGVSGGTAVTGRGVNAGTYTLSEQTQAGYTASSWTCTGGTQSGTNSIALALAGSATCTIINDDVPPGLTLIKIVTNNAGGTKTLSDFPLTASGPVTISGVSGGTAVTGRTVSAGTYTLSEQTQAGYTPSSWTCSGGTQGGTNSISIGLGGSATCTISNDDIAPTLTLVKVVTNNDGGTKTLSDFPLTASGPVTISGVSGGTAVTGRGVNAGTYTLSEQTQAGYTPSSWTCTGGTQSGTNSIALALAGSATCTISNDDVAPLLTLVKVVTNNNGGTKTLSDFPLTASGPVTISGVSGGTAVTGRGVNAGTYTLSEQTQTGYNASSWTCSGGTQGGTNSISLALGGAATCTISNDDQGPSLTLVKVVTNNAGGTKTLSDFPLTASGPVTISGVSGSTDVTGRGVNAGTYTLSEQTQAGYTPSSWTCSGGTQSGTNSITLGLAAGATCTISNDDIAPTLTLVKVVTNNDGGTKTLSDFPLTASGPVTISGVSGGTAVTGRGVNAGTYTLSEQTQAGYTPSSWTCTGGTQSGTNSIALALAGSATCTIINDDVPATLTLVKVVTNNAGGTKTLSDFPLTASGPVTISGVSGGTAVTGRSVSSGTYTLSEQTQTGYTPSSWTCSGGTQGGTNSISLGAGGSATCTISNDDIAPTLTLVKVVTNNNGGTKTLSDFPLTASGPVTISGVSGGTAVTGRGVNAGTYTLSEQTQTGYTASSWTCTGGTQSGTNSIALALAGSATCTISNDDQPATLIITKNVIGPTSEFCYTDTGTGLVATFCLTPPAANGSISQTFTGLSAGTYTVTEDSKAGYLLTDLGCVGGPILDPNLTRTVSATLALGQTKTCSFTNQFNASTTRTQGFWATHESITNAVWFGGTVGGNTFPGVTDKTLCGRPIDDIHKLLGGFWASIPFTTNKDKRSDLDKARVQLLQQLLAAILNQAAFGSSPSTITLTAAKAAYCGTDINLIKDAQTKLAAFNESGDNGTFTPGASANGKQAKDDANLTFWDILP